MLSGAADQISWIDFQGLGELVQRGECRVASPGLSAGDVGAFESRLHGELLLRHAGLAPQVSESLAERDKLWAYFPLHTEEREWLLSMSQRPIGFISDITAAIIGLAQVSVSGCAR